jgi:hypothetical protein
MELPRRARRLGEAARQLANIGLPAVVQEAIKDIPNDCGGESRKKILLAVKAAGNTLKVDATRREPK